MTEPAPPLHEELPEPKSTGGQAASVGAGIMLSRITGLARDAAVAAFFGTGFVADAYWAALKIPNIIRNLLGEGTLSAAFVPVYSEQLEKVETPESDPPRLAGTVLALVLLVATLFSGLGVLFAPWITMAVLGAADEPTRVLTTSLVRILFPMSGVMIVGAWCLGVLNSHDRFFLPFVAPTLWNVAQVAGLLLAAWMGSESLAHALAWSALVGAALQVGVQVPSALRLAGIRRPSFAFDWEPLRRVAKNTLPVISSQGIFQISSLVDLSLAGLAGTGALAALSYSQRLVYLPISLFGISVAAASLPTMSREVGAEALRRRLVDGFFQIIFFVLPAAAVLVLFGDLAVTVVFQRRAFDADSTALVSTILAAYGLGLVAMSGLKLFASGFHAMQDTATPMKIAAASVTLGIGISVALTLWLRSAGYGTYSAVGIVLGGVCGSWLNLILHWWLLSRRVGRLFGRGALVAVLRLGVATLAAAGAGVLVRGWLEGRLGADHFAGALGILLAVTLAGAVPYFLIARRPPRPGAGATAGSNDAG
ncbi:MAG TPA: murein biosynthesis integral membrane protein MurJ [Gemmatimonadota bacterium]|nr:murein biosynthesis integral membrane protein MurJ [Gemmatimonadota bacterium]